MSQHHRVCVSVQVQAALALVKMASQGVPGLLEKIRAVDRKGHWAEPVILRQFGKSASENVKVLVGKLQDKDPKVRVQAIMALNAFGLAARPAVPWLTKALQDKDDSIRFMAAIVLLRLEPNNKEALKIASNAVGLIPAMQLVIRGDRQHRIDAALEDPVLQAQFDQIIYLFITVQTLHDRRVYGIPMEPMDDLIKSLPPEAVPALVRGLNVIATLQIGFC